MEKLPAVISCLIVTVAAVTAQTAQTTSERRLPQFVTGLIALSAFLFLVFVSFLVKKAWCDGSSRKTTGDSESVRENEFVMTNGNTYDTTLDTDRKRTESDSETENSYETTLDMVRSKENRNAYDNKVTPM